MKNNLIIKLLLIPYFMFFVSAFAKQVPVKSIDNFNSNKPPKAIRFITLESEYVDNFGLIQKNSLITADIFSVKSEKRLKRDAQLLLKVKSIKNPETIKKANMSLENLYAKYVEPKDKKEMAKNAALTAGNFFVKGLSISYKAVEGAVKNEEGNVLKSTGVAIYKSSPLSYIEEGEPLIIKKGETFFIDFKIMSK